MPVSYREIKADVLARLACGAWRPGATLPTEVALAARYGCARATVNRALRELAEEGYLERRRRSGTRVRDAPARQARFAIPLTRDEVAAQGARYRHDLLARAETRAPGWLAARLGLAAGTPVLYLACLHRADDAPFQHEERWINLAALPEAQEIDFAAEPPGAWLVATVPWSDIEVAVSAAGAGAAPAAALGCAAGDPLVQIERATWFEGRAVTFVRLLYRRGYRMVTRA